MTWVCQRRAAGRKCGHINGPRVKKCVACGKLRPRKRQPAHRVALDLSYDEYVVLNGGEQCGICGLMPKPGQRHHRDHDHRTSRPRGLLCFRDNLQLPPQLTLDWLRRAVAYLERAERRTSAPPAGRGWDDGTVNHSASKEWNS